MWRFAIRTLAKGAGVSSSSPCLSFGASLAAVTTMLAIVQRRDFQPLPFKEPTGLVRCGSATNGRRSSVELPRYRPESPRFLEMAGQRALGLTPEVEASKRRSLDLPARGSIEFSATSLLSGAIVATA